MSKELEENIVAKHYAFSKSVHNIINLLDGQKTYTSIIEKRAFNDLKRDLTTSLAKVSFEVIGLEGTAGKVKEGKVLGGIEAKTASHTIGSVLSDIDKFIDHLRDAALIGDDTNKSYITDASNNALATATALKDIIKETQQKIIKPESLIDEALASEKYQAQTIVNPSGSIIEKAMEKSTQVEGVNY